MGDTPVQGYRSGATSGRDIYWILLDVLKLQEGGPWYDVVSSLLKHITLASPNTELLDPTGGNISH